MYGWSSSFTSVNIWNPIQCPIINCNLTDLQRLCDEETLEEGHHHGDEPADGAFFPVGQTVHHSEVTWHTAGGNHQGPADKHKPPRQSSLLGRISVDALLWTGAAIEAGAFQARRGQVVLEETFHSLNLPYSSIVFVLVWKTRRSQQTQFLLHVMQLPVQVSAVVAPCLKLIWGLLRDATHSGFCSSWKSVSQG